MRVAITGSSGLIGTALSRALTDRGDQVVKLVRRAPESPGEVRWDPAAGQLDPEALQGISAAVNLAGAGIGDHRWTASYKQTLIDSRVDSTRTLTEALAGLDTPVRLVSGSAMGYYGDRGEEEVDEDSAPGTGFLPDLVQRWEAAAAPAVSAGLPVAFARTGLVLAPDGGGLMKRVLPLAKLGLGGPLGNGREWWSWITLADQIAALTHLVDDADITGPVNLSTPAAVRQRDAMKALGSVLHRPTVFPAPKFGLRLVLGEFADDVVASTRMRPKVLQQNDFQWRHRSIEDAMRYAAA
ncbi:TIGR01777 family protein [Flexivirga sp. ID2601S]|uniref:TIGR01777 family protein n=1 Tax=Flexivirga aerilata TaxID=1656889 RepID=A0A849AG24_9MICO|nr:TIGR01777 family oxidoreductase [Flexivirga aerilata]NNG39784.1 TIGR01777 family protein [Flexivirga aerilata]